MHTLCCCTVSTLITWKHFNICCIGSRATPHTITYILMYMYMVDSNVPECPMMNNTWNLIMAHCCRCISFTPFDLISANPQVFTFKVSVVGMVCLWSTEIDTGFQHVNEVWLGVHLKLEIISDMRQICCCLMCYLPTLQHFGDFSCDLISHVWAKWSI